jgi:hypothetical protein
MRATRAACQPDYDQFSLIPGWNARLRKLGKARGASQSGLIVHLVALGLATESAEGDPLLRYLGAIEGPADLSATVDKTVYGAGRAR